MGYGLEFINTGDVVVLDSEFARLSVLATGRYAPTQESGLGSVTSFAQPITTQEPPLIFVRPDAVAGVKSAVIQMTVLGSAGNWTGFYVRTRSIHTAQPNGRYFAAAFAARATADFGMRLFDAGAGLIFDNGTPSAVFTRFIQNWTYSHSAATATGSYDNWYKAPFNPGPDEFMLINTHGMKLIAGDINGRSVDMIWDFAAGQLWTVTEAFSNPFDFHLSSVFGKMVA